MKECVSAAVLVIWIGVGPCAASAATIIVNSVGDNTFAGDRQCTLREAVANVNVAADTTSGDCVAGTGSGDAIRFNHISLGYFTTITLTTSAELAITKDVTISGPADTHLVIDGNNHSTRIFNLKAGTVVFSNLAIQNGGVVDQTDGDGGGGLAIAAEATITLNKCTFSGNFVPYGHKGGAIANMGTMAVTGCTLKDNSGSGGGAVFNGGAATLTDFTATTNATDDTIGSHGGAILNAGSMTLVRSNLSGNSTGGGGAGGAIYNAGMMTLIDCRLSGNSVEDDCGGGAIANSGTMFLVNSTLNDNVVGDDYEGGAIENFGQVTLTNCTVAGNHAEGGGGGIVNYSGMVTLINCTVSGNSVGADSLGGGGGIRGAATMINTIIAYNTAIDRYTNSVISQNCAHAVVDGGHNLSTDGTCFPIPDSFVVPYLAPLGYWGGPTETMPLCTGWATPHPTCTGRSPAINAGGDAVTGAPFILTTDQLGMTRLSGSHVDIGAYEVQGAACLGDCDTDGLVTVDEILNLVNIALGSANVNSCRGYANVDDEVSIDQVVTAVNNTLSQCEGSASY